MTTRFLSNLALLAVLYFFCAYAEEAVLTLESPSQISPSQVIFDTDNGVASLKVRADSSFDLLSDTKSILRYNNSADSLDTDYNIQLGRNLAIESAANYIEFNGIKQWKLWVENDFQDESSRDGWNKNKYTSCGNSPNIFMGGHCNFADDILEKTFSDLPAHEKVKITFNVHFFDEWKGESAWAQVDGQYIWTEKYNWCDSILTFRCKQMGINACGEDIPDKLSHPSEIVVKHSDPSIKLSFGSTLAGDPCLASWGLDDVRIYIA